jgi:predicted NBD/HSP70 family sugar kinase
MSSGGESVSPLNIRAWRDFPLRERLRVFTGLPTFVENDAMNRTGSAGDYSLNFEDVKAGATDLAMGGALAGAGRLLRSVRGIGALDVSPALSNGIPQRMLSGW